MNPGPVEEVGQTARGFMEIMKQQPLSLALVVMNIALLILFWYVAKTVSEQRKHEVDALYEQQKEINLLLSKCVVPEKS